MAIKPGLTDPVPLTSIKSGQGQAPLEDVYCLTTQIVNVYFVGQPGEGNPWVLVDAGLAGNAKTIVEAAGERFGADNPPQAIVLTHGHFDHVGALSDLLEQWNVPVYAHGDELAYLTGQRRYEGPYPDVGGGLISRLSRFFPDSPIDISDHVHALPEDHTVPCLSDWEWVHTPGHTPGHVSFFRAGDRALIAGDAFVTVHQEALYDVLTQRVEISGPPRYFTSDWVRARQSVERLAAMNPGTAMTGHGVPMQGTALAEQLAHLATHFDEIAAPRTSGNNARR